MLFQCWWIDGIFSCSLSWELKGVDLHNVRKRIVLLSLMFEDQRENNFKKSPFSFFATSSKRLFSLSWKNPHETNRWLLKLCLVQELKIPLGIFLASSSVLLSGLLLHFLRVKYSWGGTWLNISTREVASNQLLGRPEGLIIDFNKRLHRQINQIKTCPFLLLIFSKNAFCYMWQSGFLYKSCSLPHQNGCKILNAYSKCRLHACGAFKS